MYYGVEGLANDNDGCGSNSYCKTSQNPPVCHGTDKPCNGAATTTPAATTTTPATTTTTTTGSGGTYTDEQRNNVTKSTTPGSATSGATTATGAAVATGGGVTPVDTDNNPNYMSSNVISTQQNRASIGNLPTQQMAQGSAYPSNATIANVATGNVATGTPNNASLNNIQGGNVKMAGYQTNAGQSPLAPNTNELNSKANQELSRQIQSRNNDTTIDMTFHMEVPDHLAASVVKNIPQYTNPQQYVSGRTTGLSNKNAMPVQSLGTTYDNRLGGNYPTYQYNTQNNAATAYTNKYKPANPDTKPSAYNSLFDLFR
jgi:hypothetical protein